MATKVHQFRISGSNHLGCTKSIHDNEEGKILNELATFFDSQAQVNY